MLALVELSPVEDMLLTILGDGLPDVPIVSLIGEDPPMPFVLVRRLPGTGERKGDPRFIDSARFTVHAFTADPDGDEKGAALSEAVRVLLRNAWLEHRSVPGRGSVIQINMVDEPHRVNDGAVVSATGHQRYETGYEITIRKPR